MRPGAFKSVLFGIGLVHLPWGSAGADEAWTCHDTEARYHRLQGREIVQPGISTFILRLTSKVVSLVFTGPGGETFVGVRYSLVENSEAPLVAAGRFDRQGGRFETVSFRLDKKSGGFIQAGDRQTHTGSCSRRVSATLRSAQPSAGGAAPGSGPRLEAPLPRRRVFTGKRGA